MASSALDAVLPTEGRTRRHPHTIASALAIASILGVFAVVEVWHLLESERAAIALLPVLAALAGALFLGRCLLASAGTTVETSRAVAAKDVFAVALGALATQSLAVSLGHDIVLASGLVGLFGSLAVRPHALAIFCGSFVGMTSPAVMPLAWTAVAGLAAGLLFASIRPHFVGLGGRLGTTAFAVCATTAALGGADLPSAWHGTGGALPTELLLPMAGLGGGAAWMVSTLVRRSPLDVVGAAAAVGILAALAVPHLDAEHAGLLGAAAYIGAFVGMSASARLPTAGAYVLAGVLGGVGLHLMAGAFPGVGGKLGTLALVSVTAVHAVHRWVRFIIEPTPTDATGDLGLAPDSQG